MKELKWQDLSKEQKQYVLLGGIVLAAVLYLVFMLASGGLTDSPGAAREVVNVEDLRRRVQEAETSIRRERFLRAQYDEMKEELQNDILPYLPNEDNRYAWVTQQVYSRARALNIEVRSIDELARRGEEHAGAYGLYSVQLNLLCGYQGMIDFLNRFVQENPLMRISRVNIIPRNESPLKHTVTIVMEWPTSVEIKYLDQAEQT